MRTSFQLGPQGSPFSFSIKGGWMGQRRRRLRSIVLRSTKEEETEGREEGNEAIEAFTAAADLLF